ncbi:MAG: alpha/beta hydrolase [Bacteriovoracales bacterium]|nr:alpha/beta hydrolase [Bacteriovoracales bacterium]
MFKTPFPRYIKSHEGVSLYICTNFDPKNDFNGEEVIIFNYGLVCTNFHWEKQIPFFDQKGMKLLIYNYRGHLNSKGIDDVSKITFQSICSDLNTICEELGIHKAILFGHSMGVNVCLEFAKEFSERVAALVLIAGTIFPPEDVMYNSQRMNAIFPFISFFQKEFPEIYQFLWKTGSFNPLVRYFVHKDGFHKKETSKEFVEAYLVRAGKYPPELFVHLLKQMRNHDIIAHLDKINAPTLIVGGDEDKIIPFSVQRAISAKIPHSELYMIKDGSHAPQVDFPNSFNERAEFFLKKYLFS